MHVENQVRSLGDELGRFEQIEVLRPETGIELPESIGSAGLLHFETTGWIGVAGYGVLHEAHSWPPDKDSAVMQDLSVSCPHLRGEHPHILWEIYFHQD